MLKKLKSIPLKVWIAAVVLVTAVSMSLYFLWSILPLLALVIICVAAALVVGALIAWAVWTLVDFSKDIRREWDRN